MADFGLIKSFNIDDGELDGITPQECFVLGYELAQVDMLLKAGEPFTQLVHAQNRDRIDKSCRDAEAVFILDWMPDDRAESWMTLSVTRYNEPPETP